MEELKQELDASVPRLPVDLTSIDREELLKTAVESTSQISDPCCISYADVTFAEYLNGVPDEEKRSVFTVETKKGQRTVTDVSEHTLEENDAIIEEVGELCWELINNQIISEFPEVEKSVRELNYKNVLEPGRIVDVKDHLEGCYQINDLRFNLHPRRSCFLEQYKSVCGGEKSELYMKLTELLDQECINAEGCQYRRFFPKVRESGRVMLPESVEQIFRTILVAGCLSQGEQTAILQNLYDLYYGEFDDLGCVKQRTQGVCKIKNQCVVCTLISMHKEFVVDGGIDRPCKELYEPRDENLFLLKINNKLPGVMSARRPDNMEPLAHIYPQVRKSIYTVKELLGEYKMYTEDGVWFPVRADKDEKLIPDPFLNLEELERMLDDSSTSHEKTQYENEIGREWDDDDDVEDDESDDDESDLDDSDDEDEVVNGKRVKAQSDHARKRPRVG